MTPESVLDPVDGRKPPSTVGMTTKVVKGSIWTLTGQVAPLAVSLVTTPFVIRMLGAESYGVLILVWLIPGYLGFADFGMSVASPKFASEAYAAGDQEREARVIRTAALIALCSSVPIAVAMITFSAHIISFFNVPESVRADASLALKFASITFVVNFLNGIANGPQLTRLRMDLTSLVNAGFRILGLVAMPFAIYYGGIAGGAFVLMIASLLTLLGHLYFASKLSGHFWETSIDRAALRQILKFGGAVVLGAIAALLLANIEKLILPRMVPVRELAYYSVAFTFATMLTMFSSAMYQSLLPAFTQLQGEKTSDQLNSLFSRGIKLTLIWLIPLLVILSIIAKPFFALWAGADFGEASVLPFYVITLGLVFNLPAHVPYVAIMAAGKAKVFAALYWSELVPYLLLTFLLIDQFGATGAAMAWSIRVIVDAVILFYLARRMAGIEFYFRNSTGFFGAAVIMSLPLVASIYSDGPNLPVVGLTIVCLGMYTAIILRTVLQVEEVAWFRDQVLGRLIGSAK